MIKEIKFTLIVGLAVLTLGIGANIMAQENTVADALDTLDTTDAQISAQDLGVSDPTLLPDNPFYFLKEWVRSARLAFTFNNVKKTELESKFSNEKIVELKKMVENKVDPEKIKKATEKYQKTVDRVKNATDKIKDRAEDNPEVNKFLEKFTNQQVLQEKILQKLETQVPEAVIEKIQKAREAHLEKFQQVMTKLETNQEKIAEKIQNALQNGDTNNPEILDKIKEKMPDDVKQKIEAVRTKVIDKIIEKIKQKNPVGANCPNIMTVDPATFCPNGKIKAERDSSGCIIKIDCVKLTNEATCKTNIDCPQLNKYGSITKCVDGKCKTVDVLIKCQADRDCPPQACTTKACGNVCIKRKCSDGKCISDGLTPIKDPCPAANSATQ